MKDESATLWMGELPAEWKTARISSLYVPRNEKVSADDYPALSVTMQGIVPQLETAAKTQDTDNRKLVKEGDFVINSRSDRRGSCGIAHQDGSVSLISNVLNPINSDVMDPAFFEYLFKTEGFADEYYKWGTGIVDDLWSTNWSRMKNIVVAFPSHEDQKRIAEYLDTRTSEIDLLIEQTEHSIELLEEYRKSMISEAVTKGLNSNAPMKDSGINWIGEIPQTWSTQPLKYITLSIESGRSVDGSNYPASENEHGVLTLSSVYKASFNPQANKAVEDAESISLLRCPVKGESLLISRCNTSEWVGTAAIVENDIPNLFLPDKIWQLGFSSWALCRWIWYSLQSNCARHYFAVNSVGASSTMQNISKDDLLALVIPVPPANEQNAILAHLDKEVDAISQSVTARKSLIAKLQEYRKSLISEAVTGKFVVPGVE